MFINSIHDYNYLTVNNIHDILMIFMVHTMVSAFRNNVRVSVTCILFRVDAINMLIFVSQLVAVSRVASTFNYAG